MYKEILKDTERYGYIEICRDVQRNIKISLNIKGYGDIYIYIFIYEYIYFWKYIAMYQKL